MPPRTLRANFGSKSPHISPGKSLLKTSREWEPSHDAYKLCPSKVRHTMKYIKTYEICTGTPDLKPMTTCKHVLKSRFSETLTKKYSKGCLSIVL